MLVRVVSGQMSIKVGEWGIRASGARPQLSRQKATIAGAEKRNPGGGTRTHADLASVIGDGHKGFMIPLRLNSAQQLVYRTGAASTAPMQNRRDGQLIQMI